MFLGNYYCMREALLLTILIAGCISASTGQLTIHADTAVMLSVEIADDAVEQQRGLMGRTMLPENAGMLFVFNDEQYRSFWMKDTLMSLDILFIAANKTIVDIQTMEPCDELLCRSYVSAAPAMYALEVNAGFAERHAIELGDGVDFTYP